MVKSMQNKNLSISYFQVGAGAEEAEGWAADKQAERAGAAKSHLQPDQQREESEARSVPV